MSPHPRTSLRSAMACRSQDSHLQTARRDVLHNLAQTSIVCAWNRPVCSHGYSRCAWTPHCATIQADVYPEHQLTTHDIEIPFGSAVDHITRNATSIRQLRLLLLSASAISDARLDHSLKRISHFASLTGGEDVAIVFLLCPEKATNFITAKQLNEGDAKAHTTQGTLAYSKLQAELFDLDDVSRLPILLLSKLEGLPNLLKRHLANLSRPEPPRKPAATSLELLKVCTAKPPMSQQTAFILSDLFTDLRDLGEACTSASPATSSNSPSHVPTTSQLLDRSGWVRDVTSPVSSDTATSKLERLRDLVGEQQCQDIIDFWKNDFAVG